MAIELGRMTLNFIKDVSGTSSELGVGMVIYALIIYIPYLHRRVTLDKDYLFEDVEDTEAKEEIRQKSHQYFNSSLVFLGLLFSIIAFSYGKDFALTKSIPMFGAAITVLFGSLYINRFSKNRRIEYFLQLKAIDFSVLLTILGLAKLLQNQFYFFSDMLYNLGLILSTYYLGYYLIGYELVIRYRNSKSKNIISFMRKEFNI